MTLHRAFVGGALCLSVAVQPASTAGSVKTPLQIVSLWSNEMLEYLMGRRQAECSGESARNCGRANTGICDGTADFTFHRDTTAAVSGVVHFPSRQTNAAKPLMFKLRLDGEYDSATDIYSYAAGIPDSVELVFDCQFSGNEGCPGRFQIGSVAGIDISTLDGTRQADLTRSAHILPDGPIVIPIDVPLKKSVINDPTAMYHVRVVAECFTAVAPPIEWTFPLRTAPSETAKNAGALIVRVTPGSHIEFLYRATNGAMTAFVPDWVEEDWGYTFLMEQTILDRNEDWFQLPQRPFPTPVWIHLPGRRAQTGGIAESGVVPKGRIYRLAKAVKAHRKGTNTTLTLAAGNYMLVGIQGRVAELRKEEPFDSPCEDSRPRARATLRTYLVAAEEFYDANLHLVLTPAYTRGC
jgi:hypothetical protein